MRLLVEELITDLEQVITLNDKRIYHVKAIRPYLYCHNNPSGSFTFSLISGTSTVATKTFTANDLYTALNTTDDYIHLHFRIEFDNILPLKSGDYKLKLSSTGYTFSSNSFIGWIKEYENLKFPVNTVPSEDSYKPLTVEFWEFDK